MFTFWQCTSFGNYGHMYRAWDFCVAHFHSLGCSRTGITATEIECSCYHLTDFAAILPLFNQVPASAVLDLNAGNIQKHPTGIVAIFCVLFIFVIVFGIAIYRDRKEALVIGLKEMKQQKWAQYYEHNKVKGHRRSWRKQLKAAFQLNHTWATLINRKSGLLVTIVNYLFKCFVKFCCL